MLQYIEIICFYLFLTNLKIPENHKLILHTQPKGITLPKDTQQNLL